MKRIVFTLAAVLAWTAYAHLTRAQKRVSLYGSRPDAFPFPTAASVGGIDAGSDESIREWTAYFDCTEEQLRAAIRRVGTSPADIRGHLSRPR